MQTLQADSKYSRFRSRRPLLQLSVRATATTRQQTVTAEASRSLETTLTPAEKDHIANLRGILRHDVECLSNYQYKPLKDPAKCMRLIKLLPGDPTDEVRVCIESSCLPDHYHGRPQGYLWDTPLEAEYSSEFDADEQQSGSFADEDTERDSAADEGSLSRSVLSTVDEDSSLADQNSRGNSDAGTQPSAVRPDENIERDWISGAMTRLARFQSGAASDTGAVSGGSSDPSNTTDTESELLEAKKLWQHRLDSNSEISSQTSSGLQSVGSTNSDRESIEASETTGGQDSYETGYEAISYTWGDEIKSRVIMVESNESETPS